MLISLYVLNYNYGHFLRECIDSLEQQSDRDFEVILVDNGSSDGSREFLMEKAASQHWKFFEFPNLSLGAVGNRMMDAAAGQYVVRLDADDKLSPDFITKMKAEVHRERGPDLVFGNFYYIDGLGKVFGTHTCLPRGRGSNRGYHDEPVHGACTLIKLDTFRAKGGYDEDLPCQDGFDLYMKMRSTRIALVEDYCFYYRRGHRSLSSAKQRLFDTRNTIIDRRFAHEIGHAPNCCNVLIMPSGLGDPSAVAIESVLEFAHEAAARNIGGPTVIVLGSRGGKNWPAVDYADYWKWTETEEKSVSSKGLIARISEHYQPAQICTVNLGEPVAPIAYLTAAPKYSLLMETGGAITGTRFDQSLFRPIVGGVSQVSHRNALKDVDRWVVHTGGVTCTATARRDEERVFSLLEVEISALSNMIDHGEERASK